MSLGLCITPQKYPGDTEVSNLNPSFLRSIVYNIGSESTPADIQTLTDIGYPVLVTLNNECAEVGSDWSGWEDAVRQVAELGNGRVFGVCVGNEFDSWWANNEADVPPDFAAGLIRSAAKILRPYGIKTIATSVVSERWADYLQRMMDLCRDSVDYADVHAYGQIPDGWKPPTDPWGYGRLTQTLSRAREIAGRPVIMSEIGVQLGMAGGEKAVADYMLAVDRTIIALGTDVCPFATWFCWRDDIGKPEERGDAAFGLRAEHETPREAWSMFHLINVGATDPVPAPPETKHAEQPETEASIMSPETSAYGYIWRAANPSLDWSEQIAGFGIPTYWRQHIDTMGSPLGTEIDNGDGTVLQAFTLGVFKWTGTTVEKVS